MWSDKAIEAACAAYCKTPGAWLDEMTREENFHAGIRAALDAAAAVDGDAQWNAALDAAINFPLMLEIQSPKTGPFTREDRAIQQYRDAIRSLKRLK